jgi:hypothetical protein
MLRLFSETTFDPQTIFFFILEITIRRVAPAIAGLLGIESTRQTLVYAWTSDERTNHFVFFVGRGAGNIFDKNIFLASREVRRLGTQPKFELSWSIA